MRIQATLEIEEDSLEDLWQVYDLFNENEHLVGKLYLRRGYLPGETIELSKDTGEEE